MAEYYDEGKPPSCAITCLGMFVAALTMAVFFLVGLIFSMNNPNNILGFLVTTSLATVVVMPVGWWAAKRMKKWARYKVSENRSDESGEIKNEDGAEGEI